MAPPYTLDFETPIKAIDEQIELLERGSSTPAPHGASPAQGKSQADVANLSKEIADLRNTQESMLRKIYANLTPWQTVRVARHPERPQFRDYIKLITKDFDEIHGDRRYGDDPAIVCGFARVGSIKCMMIGHHKGRDTNEKIACHFGCAHPEGYRKALRCMKLAEKFKLPIVTFVDTPGAYPGLGAEERGQAEAIAVNLLEMSRLRTPVVSIVIGEGGSGGALGLAVSDRVAMLQHAYYSVISPEGCAAILWKEATPTTNAEAASALSLTAADNLKHRIIDTVIEEPDGGAHRNHAQTARSIEDWITESITALKRTSTDVLVQKRYERFRTLGSFTEPKPNTADRSEAVPSASDQA